MWLLTYIVYPSIACASETQSSCPEQNNGNNNNSKTWPNARRHPHITREPWSPKVSGTWDVVAIKLGAFGVGYRAGAELTEQVDRRGGDHSDIRSSPDGTECCAPASTQVVAELRVTWITHSWICNESRPAPLGIYMSKPLGKMYAKIVSVYG